MATLDMEVTVTNFNYSEDLEDPTSETFLFFQNHFRQEVRTWGTRCPTTATVSPQGWPSDLLPLQIKKIYGTIPGYEGVEITSLK